MPTVRFRLLAVRIQTSQASVWRALQEREGSDALTVFSVGERVRALPLSDSAGRHRKCILHQCQAPYSQRASFPKRERARVTKDLGMDPRSIQSGRGESPAGTEARWQAPGS